MIDKATVRRMWASGDSMIDIAESLGCRRESVWRLIQCMPSPSVEIYPTNGGFTIKTEETGPAAILVRASLLKHGWKVEG